MSKTEEKHIEKHLDKQLSKHLFSKTEFFQHHFKQHVSTAIILAFSFLIALAGKDLIPNIIGLITKEDILKTVSYLSDPIAALLVTIVAIPGTSS